MKPIIVQSPAKINMVLNLIRKREDGYHEVDFVMQELEIHDTIELESVQDSAQIILECDDPSIPLDSKNTAYKSAQLMQEECKKQKKTVQGVFIRIHKKIPSAGGLGGGSSNAAAVLKGLNELWKMRLSKNVLMRLAARIGSDVPFFIYGGTCRARGRGELITPLEKCPRLELAFITLPVKVPLDKTRWVYSHFTVEKVEHHPSVERFIDSMKSGDPSLIAMAMGNVFENNVKMEEYDSVWFLLESLKRIPGVYNTILAGAGPTICAVCNSKRTAEMIISPFKAKGYGAFTTMTV